jgi:hypothetical protein
MAALVAAGYPVSLDLLAQLAQELRLGANRFPTAQPSRWRPVGASDADEALLDGMAAVSLSHQLAICDVVACCARSRGACPAWLA